MNAKPVLKVVSCLVALFVMGSMCGYAVSSRVTHGRPAWTQSQKWAERWMEHRMTQDFARIDATPEQQAKLKPSYDRLLSDFNAIQAEASAKVADAFKRHGLEMWKQLTPEQREIIRQTNQERVSRRAANSNPPAKQ
jgi:Spy/CpxP family protein refolding chaperone